MSSEQTAERERELDRLLTFIDAAIAIAITLLVLPLVDVTREVSAGDSVADLLQDHVAELWSFLLSFVVIAQMWRAQQHSLRHVVAVHPAITRLLMVWTLTIVFLPFPTALLPEAGNQPATKVLYIGTILLSTLLLGAMTWVVIANPQIADGLGVAVASPGSHHLGAAAPRAGGVAGLPGDGLLPVAAAVPGAARPPAARPLPDGARLLTAGHRPHPVRSRTNPPRCRCRITRMRHRCRID